MNRMFSVFMASILVATTTAANACYQANTAAVVNGGTCSIVSGWFSNYTSCTNDKLTQDGGCFESSTGSDSCSTSQRPLFNYTPVSTTLCSAGCAKVLPSTSNATDGTGSGTCGS